MLVPINTKGHSCLALAIPGINNRADVKRLRNALMELIGNCVSDEELKDVTSSLSLHAILNMIFELTRDLEDKEKGE